MNHLLLIILILLSWDEVTHNTDESDYTDHSHYNIYYGCQEQVKVGEAVGTSFEYESEDIIQCCMVSAENLTGDESEKSIPFTLHRGNVRME